MSNNLEHYAAQLLQPYSPPDDERKKRHEMMNKAAIEFAGVIAAACPDCDQARQALVALTTVRMWANHAIATVPMKD